METIGYICESEIDCVMRFFETLFLDEVNDFISKLDIKATRKILYNIDLAEQTNDPKILKKLRNDIWEFRIHYNKVQYRLLAFWDKTNKTSTLVIATHGFIKKENKVPKNEIEKAIKLRTQYLKHKTL